MTNLTTTALTPKRRNAIPTTTKVQKKITIRNTKIGPLKPCPFCGFKAELICDNTGIDSSMVPDDPYSESWRVQCPDCGAKQELDLTDLARAVTVWNKRPKPPKEGE